MISIFLKLEEFSKAESLVEEHDFPVQGNILFCAALCNGILITHFFSSLHQAEKALLLAGVKFAQSDYAAATTILVKFSKQREADLLQAAASPTVGPAGGNTAALGGGGAADAEKAAAGGGTNTAPITTTAPTPKHSSLIQPVHTYMVDLNYEVMSAMVSVE